MSERKFRQGLTKVGEAAKIRESVAAQMKESIIQQRPKTVAPVDYENYVTKNKAILHNDPQREMLTFPHDDVVIPPPTPAKKMRTVQSSVPESAAQEATSLLVCEAIKSYTDSCHMVKYKYSKYSGSYQQLPCVKNPDPLPKHVFEVDAEEEEKEDDLSNRSSMATTIAKAGWLFKGPDGGKENIISFTRQFKRRFFALKQESDFSYVMNIYKDDKKLETKGAIFLDLATEACKNPKKGKYCFELRMQEKASYSFAAENDTECNAWIQTLNKVINAAETASNVSMDRIKEEMSTPEKSSDKIEHSMHPELQKYGRETDSTLAKSRQEGRQNLFRVYPYMNRYVIDDEDEEEDGDAIAVYPPQYRERFMLRLLDFKLKLQFNLGEELKCGNKFCNPEPFFLTFCLYDAKEGRKISEDFHMDPNDPQIKEMIPSDVIHASDRLHTVVGKTTSPDLWGLEDKWILAQNRQGVFSVICCHSEVYLFVRIEKVLQGPLSQATEAYVKVGEPSRNATKQYKQMKQLCNNIGHYRMPFGWAARQLVSSKYGPTELKVYRHEGSKLSEEDIIKHLQDLRKPEKQGKLQEIPATFKISLHKLGVDQPLSNSLTASLMPVKPFPKPPPDPPAVEIDEFVPDKGHLCDTFDSYTNNLYVYPFSLKYEHQKSFPKARNISCCVEVRDSDEDGAIPLKCIYARPEIGIYTTVSSTAVLHHQTMPDFLEEMKIALPIQLTDRHHLLFRFYHVSCEGSKSSIRSSNTSQKKKDNIESPVGFSCLPILSSGRVAVGEQMLPVTVNLPPGYLSHEALGGTRGSSGPDLKFVDGGKCIFKIKVHLMSTVYTKDQHLHNFFYHCQKMENSLSSGVDHESLNKLKSLHASDVSTYVKFLPTILNQLFSLLSKTECEDVAVNAVKVLVHIVSEVNAAERIKALRNYVKYVFKPGRVPRGSKQRTVHEELAKHLTQILQPSMADHLVVTKFLQHSWFFFETLIKSMTMYLIDLDRIKMPRNERFTSDYQFRIERLLQTLAPNIIQKHREMPRETKSANLSLANFVKMCFTLMDRGFVFRLISSYLENFGPGDSKTLQECKFDFLRTVCSHEHYIPLSLPLMRKGMIKTFKDIKLEDLKCDYTLSDEYRKQHYLAGLVLQELKTALNEPREIRRMAITVLRDQLAKHSFDDRYLSKTQQGRIAALYLPVISILMEQKRHLMDDPANPSVPPPTITNGDASGSTKADLRSHTSQSGQKTVTFDQRDSKVFAMIAGTGAPVLSSVPDLKNHLSGSNSSLTSSTSSMDRSEKDGSKKSDTARDKKGDKGHTRVHSSGSSVGTDKGSAPSPKPAMMLKYQRLDIKEIKDLLLCFLYILKHLPDDILLGWFNNSSEFDIIDFFGILEVCLTHFKYQGKKKIHDLSFIGDSRKASTMPYARRSTPSVVSSTFQLRTVSQYGDIPDSPHHGGASSDGDAVMKALQEANMTTEIGLIFLDLLSTYCQTFKRNLEHKDGDNSLMRKIFSLYLSFLQTSQSEHLQKHVFAAWRSFIKKFPSVLFRGQASLCGDLCYEVLRCCNSKLYSTRKEACALLYLLMRANFEYTKKKSFTRVHLQVIISVSKLLGDEVGLSNSRFQESLAMVNSYASSDRAMQDTWNFLMVGGIWKNTTERKSGFPAEVKDLTKRIRTVLMATAQMREHENDPEMLIDLQNSLAKSYASTPELRKTWLDSMAKIHFRNSNYSEAAHCYIHIAALIAEYLRRRAAIPCIAGEVLWTEGCFPQGCAAFKTISPNIELEESGIKDDSGMQDVQYTEETMVQFLEQAVNAMELAERYEILGEIYRLIIPIYEFSRDYERLSAGYTHLANAYSKVVEVTASGKRLLGKYFRVAFYGQSFFDEEDGKEYLYKEPKVTSLAEICERLEKMYGEKYGRDNVQLIKDSKQVNPAELDTKFAYIQVIHVTPYFEDKELQRRVTEFEKNNNIKRFMFETPYTENGKAHGEIHEQCKRRTILTTSHAFPFVKKRIEIVDRREMRLSPIEVAIDQMQSKVIDMKEVVNLSRPDSKKLQLRLQGSVSAQVNAGPLAYAQAFLGKGKTGDHVDSLKEVFREFVSVCNDALDLNVTLITTEQKEYHESLCAGFQEIVTKLSELFGEKILTSTEAGSLSQRGSMTVFNIVSTTSSTSSA
ncbi:dedicator of cytokinesis protein 9-like isoform X3 [Mizuhopecten yessoensis]|uniref:dedicator of cytokinesis protein 9-like isoform X3 n=1 Tax=Mizuhopecten yessoensis TaxID=6573 RepID=UPI000B457599|nr:dedicator of cytokinesis protein 9-like isoform X3 [Mizuhopecten yessoensis]